ncbi:MAG: phosphatase PAP2 family protein, partial [Draconibacterium sp.]|nr:phosphatase PAP2 family protein [Draconibacterium sp.]
RKDWFDLLILYGESHAINSDFYILSAGLISRARPFNYHSEVPIEEKTANESRNSFFSGHVSSAATASFFMAKVYSDYHPELGNKKLWLFIAALVPPSVVGYYRYKAMKHYPSDILIGLGVGATAGVLIPHLHKIKEKETKLSFLPFAGRYSGLKVNYIF